MVQLYFSPSTKVFGINTFSILHHNLSSQNADFYGSHIVRLQYWTQTKRPCLMPVLANVTSSATLNFVRESLRGKSGAAGQATLDMT